MDHPSAKTLKRFVSRAASREESRIRVAHLLKGCAECAGQLKSLLEPESIAGKHYDSALNRFDEGLLKALEGSISPEEILRNLLREDPPSPDPSLPKGRR